MLNAATSVPPPLNPLSNPFLSPGPGSARGLSPSSSPPPPSLQAVSLQDLFNSMPPVPSSQAKQEAASESQVKAFDTSKTVDAIPAGSGRVMSEVSRPDLSGAGQRQNLLNMFKAP